MTSDQIKITRQRLILHMIKGSILQEDITNLNVYTSEKVSNYITEKVIELKGETDKPTIIVRDFSTHINT